MTTYWQGLKSVENYVKYLTTYCSRDAAFTTIAAQLQHEIRELQHYNNILSQHGSDAKRKRRGLINGVGYIANSLFGVLDERFAQQYHKDIELLRNNENHLLQLYKNHTSIIEGEYNLLQRHEEVMTQQFSAIQKHLAEQDKQIRAEHESTTTYMHVTATALSANMVMNNLRRIQHMLLDLITDVKDGHIDIHLIKPEQLQEQLNIIAGQLPGDLTLPCVSTRQCIKTMYKLARVHVRLAINFLLFELKLPLVNTEQYELNRIIPIPQRPSNTTQRIIQTSKYLAVNLKKDAVIPLTDQDISSCISTTRHQLICSISLPIYDIKANINICEAQLINSKNISACKVITTECADNWIRLHRPDAWLFACCQECTMRTFCPVNVTPLSLRGTGIITLEAGCMIKGENIIINSHYNFHSEMTINEDDLYVPESSVNRIIVDKNYTLAPEDHKQALYKLKTSIDAVKVQQETFKEVTISHETHHYTFTSFIVICLIATVIGTSIYIRRRRRNAAAQAIAQDQGSTTETSVATFRHLRQLRDSDIASEAILNAPTCADKSTSP